MADSHYGNKDESFEQELRKSAAFDKPEGKHEAVEVESSLKSQSISEASSPGSNYTKKLRSLFHRKSDNDDEKSAKRKEKRESMSDRGAFRIEYSSSGLPIAVENRDWPPGVNYKTSSQVKQLQNGGGPGAFYENQGAVAPGGETAGNTGPDPDWVPNLTEEERKKLRSDSSGRYGELSPFLIALHEEVD